MLIVECIILLVNDYICLCFHMYGDMCKYSEIMSYENQALAVYVVHSSILLLFRSIILYIF